MTVRYVDGTLGNDAWNGLSPTFVAGLVGPKATLNGVEDTPVVAGDLVHVRPGVYRELLTVDVSGLAANIIEYRGDYVGAIWASTAGQVVRITGSNNDQTTVRTYCIQASAKNYRTFTNFAFDMTTTTLAINMTNGCAYITFSKCYTENINFLNCAGLGQSNVSISNCAAMYPPTLNVITFTHTVTVDNSSHTISNCAILGHPGSSAVGIVSTRIGGIVVKNSIISGHRTGVQVSLLSAGQTFTVNNSIIMSCNLALQSDVLGSLLEDFNALYNNVSARSNVAVGASSNAYPMLSDSRWFFQVVNEGAGPNSPSQVITPFDLGSYSQLINVAGTTPTATDMRGTGTIGAQREWGALEYDSTLKIEGGAGAVSISPFRGNIG